MNSLVTNLQLGHALGLEALLPRTRDGMNALYLSTPTKQSFGDKCVHKLELGNEKVMSENETGSEFPEPVSIC